VLGLPWDSSFARAVEGLVLTEWKVLRPSDKIADVVEAGIAQTKHYTEGILAGLELASTRYVVVVSAKQIPPVAARVVGKISYEVRNVVVSPDVPSVAGKKAAIQTKKNKQ
jgi:hypothetical protein